MLVFILVAIVRFLALLPMRATNGSLVMVAISAHIWELLLLHSIIGVHRLGIAESVFVLVLLMGERCHISIYTARGPVSG